MNQQATRVLTYRSFSGHRRAEAALWRREGGSLDIGIWYSCSRKPMQGYARLCKAMQGYASKTTPRGGRGKFDSQLGGLSALVVKEGGWNQTIWPTVLPPHACAPWGEGRGLSRHSAATADDGELKTDLFQSTLNHPNSPLVTLNHPFLRKKIFFSYTGDEASPKPARLECHLPGKYDFAKRTHLNVNACVSIDQKRLGFKETPLSENMYLGERDRLSRRVQRPRRTLSPLCLCVFVVQNPCLSACPP